jgi:hypothetical protein
MSKRRTFESPVSALLAMLPFALLTVVGMFALLAFDGTAGPAAPSPTIWPQSSGIAREPGKFTALVFAHPLCPCTRATLYELSRVLDSQQPEIPIRTKVLFVRPAGDNSWQPTDIWKQAEDIPGANASWDENGVEARRFGAKTSGMMLLYDARGRLLFEGGITGSRGHIGDNYGAQRLSAALERGIRQSGNPPFGCSLAISNPDETGAR